MRYPHLALGRLCLGFLLASMIVACASNPTPAGPNLPGMALNITAGPCPSGSVRPGDAVSWTNADSVEHQIRGVRDGVVIFDSGILKPGDTFTFTFPDEGQFPYTCSLDGTSTGTIEVKR